MSLYPKNKILGLLVTLILITFSSCTDESSMPDDALIEAGQSLAGVSISDTFGDVKEVHGEGTQNQFTINQTTMYSIDYPSKGLTFFSEFLSDTDGFSNEYKIFQVTCYNPYDGLTSFGIGINSTSMDVIAAYGEPDNIQDEIYEYFEGIEFVIENDQVVEINVFE